MYHLGLWFDSSVAAGKANCPVTNTPFNGEHKDGLQVLNTSNFPDDHGPLRDMWHEPVIGLSGLAACRNRGRNQYRAVEPGWLVSTYAPVVVRPSTRNRNIPGAVELHDSLICDGDNAVACIPGAGGNGAAGVMADASLEYADSPDPSSDRIRYAYAVFA